MTLQSEQQSPRSYGLRHEPRRTKITARSESARQRLYGRGYPVRPSSIFVSLVIHGITTVLLVLVAPPTQAPVRPIYDELIRPQAHKIIWYDFRKKLPDVKPTPAGNTALTPRGVKKSNRVLIAASPNARSSEQFIWLPAPQIEIHQDIPLPNLIARIRTPPPELENSAKPRRAFTPPPQAPRQPRIPVQAPAIALPAPDPSMLGSSNIPKSSIDFRGATLPAPPAPPQQSNNAPSSPGNSVINVAVASTHPTENNETLPTGERPGRFSEAPIQGAAGVSGAGRATDLTIPNLTVRDMNRTPGEGSRPGAKTILYTDVVRSLPSTTLSVPLRPGSRRIPAAVDARFQGRYVYAMVLPMENLSPYAGDWILWFAERDQKAGDAPLIRSPVPFRKIISGERAGASGRMEQRMQLAAVITKDGRIESASLLTKAAAAIEQTFIQDLTSWEFKPATRDGAPVNVDVIVEIPFLLSPEIATHAGP